MGTNIEQFPSDLLPSVNDACSFTFVFADTMHPSAENQVRVGFLGEAVSESWVSMAFFHHYLRTQLKNTDSLVL